MGLKKIMINMGMMGLFVFCTLAFVVTTQEDNSVTNKITDNQIINETYEDLRRDLQNSDSGTVFNASSKNPPTNAQLGDLQIGSMVSPINFIKSTTLGFWNIFIKLPSSVLGVNPIVFSILGSILLMILIIGGWAIWKGAVN